MRKTLLVAALLLSSFAGGFAANAIGPMYAQDAGERTITADRVVCHTLVVKDEHNKCRATLRATPSICGLWISNSKKEQVAIYSGQDHSAIGLYANSDKANGLNIAVSIDREDGEPFMQWIDKAGKIRLLQAADLRKSFRP